MNLTASLLLDLVLLLLLVLFFVQGLRRGFILTLCSLLAVFVALAGGWYLASHYVQPVQDVLEPKLLERLIPDRPEVSEEGDGEAQSIAESVQDQVEDAARTAQTAVMVRQAKALAALTAKVLLFLAGFVGVLLIWLLLCHALNLVTKLPGLNALNKAMGGILGLVKGLILLLVLQWLLCDTLALIPDQVAEGSYVLSVLTVIRDLPAAIVSGNTQGFPA